MSRGAEDDDKPKLNMSDMKFPTDQITIGQMRRRDPGMFEGEKAMWSSTDADAARCFEIALATRAFARRLSLPDPCSHWGSREELVDCLNSTYMAPEFGISSGMAQTRELCRDIEAAAERQAEKYLGKSR